MLLKQIAIIQFSISVNKRKLKKNQNPNVYKKVWKVTYIHIVYLLITVSKNEKKNTFLKLEKTRAHIIVHISIYTHIHMYMYVLYMLISSFICIYTYIFEVGVFKVLLCSYLMNKNVIQKLHFKYFYTHNTSAHTHTHTHFIHMYIHT